MSDEPPERGAAEDAETAFLTRLWDNLEAALEIAIAQDVLNRLGDVLVHCEAAADAIRRWRADHS